MQGLAVLVHHQFVQKQQRVALRGPKVTADHRRGMPQRDIMHRRGGHNAYEALTKLPGVKETKGVLTLAGTGNLTVVLNGKPTTMDAGQLETLLRNTPLDRVEKAEVMYSAPPEYHVR